MQVNLPAKKTGYQNDPSIHHHPAGGRQPPAMSVFHVVLTGLYPRSDLAQKGRQSRVFTCIVVLGAVSEVRFVFENKLRQRESFGDLDGPVFLPLEDQVIHGVTD